MRFTLPVRHENAAIIRSGDVTRRTILGGTAAAAIAAAFAIDSTPAWAWQADCTMPTPAPPSNILWNHPFASRRFIWLGGHYGSRNACSGSTTVTCSPRGYCHDGIDFSAPQGTAIYSVAAGTVVGVNNSASGSLGYNVTIDHGGASTTYGHMKAGSVVVAIGQTVGVEKIGEVGATGSGTSSTAFHLHLEMRVGGTTTDPALAVLSAPLPGSPGAPFSEGPTSGRIQHDMELYAANPPSTIPAKYLALNSGLVPGPPLYMLLPAVGIPRVTQDQVLVGSWAQSLFGQSGNTAVIQISWGWLDQLFDQHVAIAQSLGA